MEEPETLRAVLEKAQTFATAWANAQIKAGCHVIALVEGSASKSVIPEMYLQTWSNPYYKLLYPKFKPRL